MARHIYLDNKHTAQIEAQRLSDVTGDYEPVAFLQPHVFLAATPDATEPLAPLLDLPMAELPTTGRYAATFPTEMLSPLADYVNETIFEVVVVSGEARVYTPLLVLRSRHSD